MKIILCGAGQVGSAIARYLATEDLDLTIIDRSPERVRRLGDTLDVQIQIGEATHPDVLEDAGAEDADMLIAVTASDEINMLVCVVADELFGVPTKIARIRHQGYLKSAWAKLFRSKRLPIDEIISPEIEVARNIARRLKVPGAFELIPLANGRLQLAGVHCLAACPIAGSPVAEIARRFADLRLVVVGLVRDGQGMIPAANERIRAGDDVYIVVGSEHLQTALEALGHREREARRVVIAGGGNIGLHLTRMIEETAPEILVKVIEANGDRAAEVSRLVGSKTVVFHGDVLDPNILHEVGIAITEAIVAVTNDDETNILASMLAKRDGCERAVTLINKPIYDPLIDRLGVDSVVSPRAITVSTILEHIRRGRVCAAHSLREGFGEIIEVEIAEGSGLVGRSLAGALPPKDVILAAVVRDGEPVTADRDLALRPRDRLIIMAGSDVVGDVAKRFA